jgi:hypothetical protein
LLKKNWEKLPNFGNPKIERKNPWKTLDWVNIWFHLDDSLMGAGSLWLLRNPSPPLHLLFQVPASCVSLQLLVATKNKQECTIYRVWCSICSLITYYILSIACLCPCKTDYPNSEPGSWKNCVFPGHPFSRYNAHPCPHHSIQKVTESRFNEKINKNPCFISFWISWTKKKQKTGVLIKRFFVDEFCELDQMPLIWCIHTHTHTHNNNICMV